MAWGPRRGFPLVVRVASSDFVSPKRPSLSDGPTSPHLRFRLLGGGSNSKTFLSPPPPPPEVSSAPSLFQSLILGPKALICLFSIFISLILQSTCVASQKVSNTNFHFIESPRCGASTKRQRKDFPGPRCRSPARTNHHAACPQALLCGGRVHGE